eukprot:TRINITY_DN2168_c0_g1_i1.p1 TRINITY_DN2168_c0_g1~~TRINITY_DN2168_c0_g1_i1.p1  ORF type:complete len:712 (+),score=149.83 TRINITY_DN2168_c0_g1_i1:36-2171(+)
MLYQVVGTTDGVTAAPTDAAAEAAHHLQAMVFMSSDTLYKSAPQNSQLLYIMISTECRKLLGLTQSDVADAGVRGECMKYETRHLPPGENNPSPLICKMCNPTKAVVTVTQCINIEECREPVDYHESDCMVSPELDARLTASLSSSTLGVVSPGGTSAQQQSQAASSVTNTTLQPPLHPQQRQQQAASTNTHERYHFHTRIFCTSSRDHLYGSVAMKVELLPLVHVWSHPFVLRSRNTQTQSRRGSARKAVNSDVIMFWRPNVSLGRRKVAEDPTFIKREDENGSQGRGPRGKKRRSPGDSGASLRKRQRDSQHTQWHNELEEEAEADSGSADSGVEQVTSRPKLLLPKIILQTPDPGLRSTALPTVGTWEASFCQLMNKLMNINLRLDLSTAIFFNRILLDEKQCNEIFGHLTALTCFIAPGAIDTRFSFFASGTVLFRLVTDIIAAINERGPSPAQVRATTYGSPLTSRDTENSRPAPSPPLPPTGSDNVSEAAALPQSTCPQKLSRELTDTSPQPQHASTASQFSEELQPQPHVELQSQPQPLQPASSNQTSDAPLPALSLPLPVPQSPLQSLLVQLPPPPSPALPPQLALQQLRQLAMHPPNGAPSALLPPRAEQGAQPRSPLPEPIPTLANGDGVCVSYGCFHTAAEAQSFHDTIKSYFANTATVPCPYPTDGSAQPAGTLPFPNTFHQDLSCSGVVSPLGHWRNF